MDHPLDSSNFTNTSTSSSDTLNTSDVFKVEVYCHQLPEPNKANNHRRFRCIVPKFVYDVMEQLTHSEMKELDEHKQKMNKLDENQSKLSQKIKHRMMKLPEFTSLYCYHDCHPIDQKPFLMPTHQDSLTKEWSIYTEGLFCSINCAKAHLLENTNHQTDSNLFLLDEFAYQVMGITTTILPAPSRCRLSIFGGDLSIIDFRKHCQVVSQSLRIPTYMVVHSMVFEEQTEQKHKPNNTSLQNMDLMTTTTTMSNTSTTTSTNNQHSSSTSNTGSNSSMIYDTSYLPTESISTPDKMPLYTVPVNGGFQTPLDYITSTQSTPTFSQSQPHHTPISTHALHSMFNAFKSTIIKKSPSTPFSNGVNATTSTTTPNAITPSNSSNPFPSNLLNTPSTHDIHLMTVSSQTPDIMKMQSLQHVDKPPTKSKEKDTTNKKSRKRQNTEMLENIPVLTSTSIIPVTNSNQSNASNIITSMSSMSSMSTNTQNVSHTTVSSSSTTLPTNSFQVPSPDQIMTPPTVTTTTSTATSTATANPNASGSSTPGRSHIPSNSKPGPQNPPNHMHHNSSNQNMNSNNVKPKGSSISTLNISKETLASLLFSSQTKTTTHINNKVPQSSFLEAVMSAKKKQ